MLLSKSNSEMSDTERRNFIDRSPGIKPAGIVTWNPKENMKQALTEYHESELEKPCDRCQLKYDLPPVKGKRNPGIFTDIRPILRPEPESHMQTIANELKETVYKSHWESPLGRGKDQIPGLPKGFKVLETTFGDPSTVSESVKSLVNPDKSYDEIIEEEEKGHDLYKRTHCDYNIGEKVNRGYNDAFNPNKRFGIYATKDVRGTLVRCTCQWFKKEPITITNRIKADFTEKNVAKLGKSLTPNNNISCVPPGHIFGKLNRKDACQLEDLLKDYDFPFCCFKRNFNVWISAYNLLKNIVAEKIHRGLNLTHLVRRLRFLDTKREELIPLEDFYQVCAEFHIAPDKQNLEPLLELIEVIKDGRIKYRTFIDMLNPYKPVFLELRKINDVPPEHQYYLTSSQAATCDYLIMDNTNFPPAGIPSIRFDLPWPIIQEFGCKADLENFGDETSVEALISPSIFTNYGLSFRDFLLPRSKHYLKKLFDKIGYKIGDEIFEVLWEKGVENDKTGLVCIDTFYKIVKKHFDSFCSV